MGRRSSPRRLRQNEPAFVFEPHSDKQSQIVFSEANLTIAACGTQYGKSLAGAAWFLRQLHLFSEPGDNFIVASPTYKILQQSILPYFLTFARHLGVYSKVDSVFELFDGRRVFFRTETDPDSVVGIPKTRAYWLDEAGKVSLYFHENLQARAAAVGARGLYTTSPYSRNWLYKNYIKPKGRKELPGITLVQAASWENPYHSLADPDKRRQMRAEMDPRRFEMLFGGEWGKQSGLVYDCFDDVENVCDALRLPNGTQFYGGIDWGHTEPFVIVVRAITPDGLHYQVSEFYKTGMTIVEQRQVALSKMQTWGIKQFYCGHERPENILLFNQAGIPAVPVPEKKIQAGTDLHYELIKTRRYKVFAGSSPYTLDEYETYHYPEPTDLKADEEAKDNAPVGQFDHCMSANRFITLRTYRGHLKRLAFTPDDSRGPDLQETQEARLRRLTRPIQKTRIIQ